jgi:hypothetical protein
MDEVDSVDHQIDKLERLLGLDNELNYQQDSHSIGTRIFDLIQAVDSLEYSIKLEELSSAGQQFSILASDRSHLQNLGAGVVQ